MLNDLVPVEVIVAYNFVMRHLHQLIFGQSTILVFVDSQELLLKIIKFLLSRVEAGGQAEHDLLKVRAKLILDQVLLDAKRDLFLHGVFWHICDPWVLKQLVDSRTLLLVTNEAAQDELLSICGDVSPLGAFELQLLVADVEVDVFDGLGIKRSNALQQLVCNDAHTPDVNFLCVSLVHHQFWSHV
jgi:hypothetical protein